MNQIELYFLELGWSWTFAKIAYYLLFIFIGIGFSFFFHILFKPRNWMRKLTLILFSTISFLIGFILQPIYEGDFSNDYEIVNSTPSDIKPKQLTLIAIPGCPYCYEAIDRLLLLKKRNEFLSIHFVVCSDDSTQLEWYQEKIKDAFDVKLATDLEKMQKLAKGRFPTFVYQDQQGITKRWSNDQFGVVAIDYIEKEN